MKVLRLRPLIPLLTPLIALLALGMGIYAAFLSPQAGLDARAIARLDLTADVRLQASLNQTPALLRVRNQGPVDAVQLDVAVIYVRYRQSSDLPEIKMIMWDTDLHWQFERLRPGGDIQNAEVSRDFLDINARLENPLRYNVLVVRLEYRRDSDLREFAKEAYYFLNPEGRWVTENDNSIAIDDYKDVRTAVMASRLPPQVNFTDFWADVLHDVEPNR